MNSLINNNVNIGGAQDVTGAKTFAGNVTATGALVKKSLTMDIDNPDGVKANQILLNDKNDVTYNFVQSAQFATGQMQFGLACKAASANSYSELGLIQKADGTGWAYTPDAQELGAASGYQVCSVNNARARTGFDSGESNRTTISSSLSTDLTMPADGLFVATLEVSGAQAQITVLLGGSNGYVICRARHDGGTTESNKIPVCFLVRKGQIIYLKPSSTGSCAVDIAYLWQFPYQGV